MLEFKKLSDVIHVEAVIILAFADCGEDGVYELAIVVPLRFPGNRASIVDARTVLRKLNSVCL